MRIPTQSDFGVPGVLNRHRRRHASSMGDDSMDFERPSHTVAQTADDDRVERNMRLVAVAIVLTLGVIWASTLLL
jgi:hypothetical protein